MDYEKLYKEALERTKYFMSTRGVSPNEDPFEVAKELSEIAFPELKESEDNKTKRMLAIITYKMSQHQPDIFTGEENEWFNAWLEKQGEQKPTMIQWKGDNLKEVIDFTGVYKEGFEKWFHNSWEEYEKYVHEHNNIFKIFNEDGSHIEVPVGAWIVKTPDGYNTASRYVFKQKSAEWSKEDEELYNDLSDTYFFNDEAYPENTYKFMLKRVLDWMTKRAKSLRPQMQWKAVDKKIYVKEPALAQRKDKSEPNHGYVICYDHTLTPDVYERFIMISDIYNQSHWKPSEKQMKWLHDAIESTQYEPRKQALISLYSDLMELKD